MQILPLVLLPPIIRMVCTDAQHTDILISNQPIEKRQLYSAEFYDNVINAAPMHDLGKIAVKDAILRKPGAFTPEEYAEMKTHAAKGGTDR